MMGRRTLISASLLAGLLAAASMTAPGRAQAPQQPRQVLDLGADPDDVVLGEPEYSPYLYQAYPQQVYWGDTHLHTSYSTDAGMIGNRLGPEDAYRFAMGEVVVSSLGVRASSATARLSGHRRPHREPGTRANDRGIEPRPAGL